MAKSLNGRVLYTDRDLPIFQNRMYEQAAEARSCPTGDIILVEDWETGRVYNAAFDAARMDYDDRYQNEQACSAKFKAHLEGALSIIKRSMGKAGLIEVGCGKGFFLEMCLKHV